jgi:hypothetical protein
LATELLQHGVISLAEREEIYRMQDLESKAKTLYEIVLKKPPVCFRLLLKCLRSSGNENMAKLIENSWEQAKKGRVIYRRSSSTTDRYIREEVGNMLIVGREMGIAEIFEEDQIFAKNWRAIFHILDISSRKLAVIETYSSFAVKATLMLREWAAQEKQNGSLANLMNVLDKRGHMDTAIRVKRMFEDFTCEAESGFLFEFQETAHIPICSPEIIEVARVLEDNPDFALQWEKLFLLLQLPMQEFHQFSDQATFVDNTKQMLTMWKDMGGSHQRTYYELASLLVQNGHRSTGGKILVLGTM